MSAPGSTTTPPGLYRGASIQARFRGPWLAFIGALLLAVGLWLWWSHPEVLITASFGVGFVLLGALALMGGLRSMSTDRKIRRASTGGPTLGVRLADDAALLTALGQEPLPFWVCKRCRIVYRFDEGHGPCASCTSILEMHPVESEGDRALLRSELAD